VTLNPHKALFADDCPYCVYEFAALSPEIVGILERASTLHHHDAGSTLFRAGQAPSMVWVLTTGTVRLSTNTGPVRTATSGELLGVAAALLDQPYAVSAVCMQPSLVASAPRSVLVKALTEHRAAGQRLGVYASTEAHRSERHFPPTLYEATCALADVVLDFLSGAAEASETELTFTMDTLLKDVVRSLQAHEPSLSLAMAELEHRQILYVHAPFITIHDAAALRRLRGSAKPRALAHG
jgi:CRP-like cAMP-binding protein